MDWKDALASLSGLPEGEEPKEESSAKVKPERKSLGKLHVTVEKKGRGGKTATIIDGFECQDAEIAEIARELRRRLGTGGSSRGGEILIQGDRREDVMKILKELGMRN